MAVHSYAHARKTYGKVLTALVILTAITVYAASFHFGSANVVVALLIASMKASLVALFFMHLKYEKPINAIIFLVGLLTLAIFLIFIILDEDSRVVYRPADLKPPPGGPGSAAVAAEVVPGATPSETPPADN